MSKPMSPTFDDDDQLFNDLRDERDKFLQLCRPAQVADYTAWLTGYFAAGGRVTHEYDHNLKDDNGWFVLLRQGQHRLMPSLYGALSIQLIIPAGFAFSGPDKGHSNVYFIDGFRAAPGWYVPTYDDVRNALLSLPTARELANMHVAQIRARLNHIQDVAEDPKRVRELEDDLYLRVLQAIAGGADDPAAMATEALKSKLISRG